MNRGLVIAGALAAAAAAAIISVRACAATAPAPAFDWEPGVNYQVLGRPQATGAARGKVEVAEVFWYGCGHCYALDPALENWKQKKPAYIEFVRIPVMWGPPHEQHARLFYTMLALGRGDLHTKIFDTIHKEGNALAAETDAQARALHLAFFQKNGVTEAQFNAAYDSAEVAQNVERARSLTGRYEVASVPLIIVNGTYSTSVSQAGDEQRLLALINDLAAREKSR
jgi:thiol:disulfide interchange protein DsbA